MIVKQSVGGDHECAGAQFHQDQEGRIEVALAANLQDVECSPSARAASCAWADCAATPGRVGLTRTATDVAEGTSSCSRPSRFAPRSAPSSVKPVMFPPGRLKLATKPICTGSAAFEKTIGIVAVADFAANAEAGLPTAAMSDTRRRTRSVAS